jgi:spermidine/putrescine transport system permease protein
MPAIVAGSLLAFTFSLDDVVTSFFLNGSVNTLPLVILSLIRFSVTPEVNAIGVMLMTVTTTLMVCFLVINHRWARSGA